MKTKSIPRPKLTCDACNIDHSLFCCLSLEERCALSENKGENYYRKGQAVFYERNHPPGLYCIASGRVKLAKLAESGKEKIVRLAGKGDLLGYRALLSSESYRATATALEDSHICLISKDRFMELLSRNFDLSKNLLHLLADDLRHSEQTLIDITQKSVRERVLETLLLLRKKFGLEKDGKTLQVVLSRREIGDLVGITTETSIRMLSSLKKEGLIALEGKRILLLDLPSIIREANLED